MFIKVMLSLAQISKKIFTSFDTRIIAMASNNTLLAITENTHLPVIALPEVHDRRFQKS